MKLSILCLVVVAVLIGAYIWHEEEESVKKILLAILSEFNKRQYNNWHILGAVIMSLAFNKYLFHN